MSRATRSATVQGPRRPRGTAGAAAGAAAGWCAADDDDGTAGDQETLTWLNLS